MNYHEVTKHYPNKLAKSLGYLDWENQPSPYKEYINAEKIKPTGEIATFLKNSFAINAKKVLGFAEWYVRVNPSSGNLHPEEVYILNKDGLFHFQSKDFTLEKISDAKTSFESGFILISTSIPLRESWKYGERALRYTLLDTGHSIAAANVAATLIGKKFRKIDFDASFLKNQNFYKNEEEFVEAVFFVGDEEKIEARVFNLNLEYKRLAKDSYRWDLVFEAMQEFEKEDFEFESMEFKYSEEIIQKRRSGLNFVPFEIDKETFFKIIDIKTPFKNKLDLIIFIHRVKGINPGLYYYDGELRLIKEGDFREEAEFISCHQEIASNSSFSLGIVGDFNYSYKEIMLNAGFLGHMLYLNAEKYDLRGTGIGCFFDDLVNQFLPKNKQTLYHFTIGKPVVDERIVPLHPLN